MNRTVSTIGAAGIGAGLMYLFDPDRGVRRRAVTKDKAIHAANMTGKAIATVWRDAGNRGSGILAELGNLIGSQPPDDTQLAERVRAELGFLVDHPGAIEVSAKDGCVTLYGPIHSAEIKGLLSRVWKVRGVKAIDNQLDPHGNAEAIPALQGGPPRSRQGRRFEWFQTNWSPTARFLAGATGVTLLLYGLMRRNITTILGGLGGTTLLTRAATNLPIKRLVGIGAGHRAIDIRKTMRIGASRPHVFEFWSRYHDFPRYTAHVLDVQPLNEGRSRWTVMGPAGIEFSWNSVITEAVPNVVLAWKTEPGSVVQHAGLLRFTDSAEGGTTIHVQLSYNPPGGALGHGAAKTMGRDLESLFEEEFTRIKTFLETGIVARDAARREEPSSSRV